MHDRSAILLAVLTWAAAAVAQPTNPPPGTAPTAAAPPSAPAKLSAAELEKLAMPIALHPDPLVSIILPAAAYPLEIVQAARFVRDTNNIPKADTQPWDANVKALAKFPEMLAKMDADLTWTVALGEAFINQPKDLMNTIQALRAKAQKAGTLQTTAQQVVTVTNVVTLQTNVTQVVTVTNQIIQLQPTDPQVVYVPTYPSTVYYPPPAYVYDPLAPLVSFGVGIAVGAIIANNCDWHGGCVWVGGGGAIWVGGGGYHGDVDIDIDNEINIDRDRGDRNPSGSERRAGAGSQPSQQKWQPDQNRLRTSGAPTSTQTREARGWAAPSSRPPQTAAQPSGSYAQKSWGPAQTTPRQPTTQPRPTTPGASSLAAGARPSSSGVTPSRPASTPAGNRPAPQQSVNRASPQPSSAFSGVSSGGGARDFSSRGASSRGGSMRGGGRGR